MKTVVFWLIIGVGCVTVSPFLLVGLLMAKNLGNALFSPTINSVRYSPAPEVLAGQYRESRGSTIYLRSDGTATINSIPGFDGFGDKLNCTWNGEAQFRLFQHSELSFRMTNRTSEIGRHGCAQDDVNYGFTILGQKPPFRLYMTIGDPDAGEGLTFNRVDSDKVK